MERLNDMLQDKNGDVAQSHIALFIRNELDRNTPSNEHV